MTVSSKTTIKAFFEQGDFPTQSNFSDLIDSYQDYAKLVALQDTGAVNAYVITPSPAITAYALGHAFLVRITNTNSGGSTLNVNGLGAKSITYSDGTGLSANVLMLSALALVAYDGTNFQLINVSPATGGSGITQLVGDVTATGTGAVTATIASAAVTFSKFQNVSANSFLCNPTSAAASVQEVSVSASTLVGRGATGNLGQIALGTGLSMSGQTLNVSGSGSQLHSTVFTASGTFTTSSSITTSTLFKIAIVGAGGGGGGITGSGTGSGGGGAGATAIYYITGLAPSTGYTVTIGAAGAAGVTTTGGTGGNSSILINAVTVTAAGGLGGVATGSTTVNPLGGVGGTGTNGTINISGGDGSPGTYGTSTDCSGGTGGSSSLGGGGGGAGGSSGNNAGAGKAYGGGGGGASVNGTAGAGKAGIVIVEWNE